jgi:CRISPR type III-A/MTUBE-associated protein Csm6
MNKYVLFSPVGSTDPIRGSYDGAMIHIVRHYTPQKVYLFFTAEMCKIERETNCFSKSIKHIAPECEVIPTPTDIEDPSDFDAFHNIFARIINRITDENPNTEILLNITSATPQIQATLCLEAVTHNAILKPIQVTTPAKSANKERHFDPYKDDVSYEMDNLLDNLDEAECRCKEPDLIAYKKGMIKRQIIGLIESYEYKGAFDLVTAKENAPLFTKRLHLLLKHAYYRSLPNEKEATAAAQKLAKSKDLYPVENNAARKVCEYYLASMLRQKRGQLTDFTLRLFTLTEHLLREEVGQKLGGWANVAVNTGRGWKLNRKMFEANLPEISTKLDNEYKPQYTETFLTGQILESFVSVLGITGYENILKLRNKRNDATHELEYVTENSLGVSSALLLKDTYQNIKRVYGNHIKEKIFDMYERLNDWIKEELSK